MFVYQNSNSNKLISNRTAYVRLSDNDKHYFKYSKMERSDISKINALKGIEMEENSFIIRTMDSYIFQTTHKIIINNKQYKIKSIYTEEQENSNGPFIKNMNPFKYLVLVN